MVSVLLPVRNSEHTLGDALDSILAQTHRDFEIIVLDDGSTDRSPDLAEQYARRDSRVRAIRSAHVGIVEALRVAALHASGDLLARMDADDIAEPDRLEHQMKYLHAHPEVGLCGTLVTHFGDPAAIGRRRYLKWINGLQTPDALERERFVECPIAHPTFMMRREAYDAAGGYVDHGWAEDYDLVLRIHRAGWRLGKVAEPLLRWRHSATRLSVTSPRYAPEQFRALKRSHLIEGVLNADVPFYQWGAGEVGKPWLREWGTRAPVAVVDINPRKVGTRIHGVPVIAPDDLPPPGDAVVLVAVGAPGARDVIRGWFGPRGYAEARDYYFIA